MNSCMPIGTNKFKPKIHHRGDMLQIHSMLYHKKKFIHRITGDVNVDTTTTVSIAHTGKYKNIKHM